MRAPSHRKPRIPNAEHWEVLNDPNRQPNYPEKELGRGRMGKALMDMEIDTFAKARTGKSHTSRTPGASEA